MFLRDECSGEAFSVNICVRVPWLFYVPGRPLETWPESAYTHVLSHLTVNELKSLRLVNKRSSLVVKAKGLVLAD